MLFFIKALVALVTVIDPVGLVPVVLALTSGLKPEERSHVVTRAIIIAAGVIAVFAVLGQMIFASLGVTSEAFSIAGGALLFLVAIDMLFGRQSGTRETPREQREQRSREDLNISVFPLAIPMIAGPGTITTIILLVDSANGELTAYAAIAAATAITLVAALLAMLVSTQ